MTDTETKLFDADVRKKYTGTKTLFAWPLTRGDYNKYRSWAPPKDEDQTTPGYLVEYEADGKPNDERHAGYISWSPADVFESTYHEVQDETFITRMQDEGAQLAGRLTKLNDFIGSPDFDNLPLIYRDDLKAQQTYMTKYLDVLARRYVWANAGANIHGIGPDTDGGDNPNYVAEDAED